MEEQDEGSSSVFFSNPYEQGQRGESPVEGDVEDDGDDDGNVQQNDGESLKERKAKGKRPAKKAGRCVTIIFSGEEEGTSEGNLEIWVDDGESVGSVKDQVS